MDPTEEALHKAMTDDLLVLFTLVLALATIALVWVAWKQLGDAKAQQRSWESLKACEKYDFDPVLNDVLKTLRTARRNGSLFSDPDKYSLEIFTLLNYLEGLVAGIQEGFYNEEVVRSHMDTIIRFHVAEFLNDNITNKLNIQKSEYGKLVAWTEGTKPWYMRNRQEL